MRNLIGYLLSDRRISWDEATSFKGFLYSIMRREKVHPDHNCYFSYRTSRQLLEKFSLTVEEVYYYQEVEGHGFAKVLDKAISFATWMSPAFADGLVVRATVQRLAVDGPVAVSEELIHASSASSSGNSA